MSQQCMNRFYLPRKSAFHTVPIAFQEPGDSLRMNRSKARRVCDLARWWLFMLAGKALNAAHKRKWLAVVRSSETSLATCKGPVLRLMHRRTLCAPHPERDQTTASVCSNHSRTTCRRFEWLWQYLPWRRDHRGIQNLLHTEPCSMAIPAMHGQGHSRARMACAWLERIYDKSTKSAID